MSVINDMLRDLDQRQGRAEGASGAAPGDAVRSVADASQPQLGKKGFLLVVAALAAGAAAAWWLQQPRAQAMAADPLASQPVTAVNAGPAAAQAAPAPAAAAVPAPVAGVAGPARDAAPASPLPPPTEVAAVAPAANPAMTPAKAEPVSPKTPAAATLERREPYAPRPAAPLVALAQPQRPASVPQPASATLPTASVAAPAKPAPPAPRPEAGKLVSARQAAANLVAEAAVLERQGRADEARGLLQRALALYPADTQARQMLVQQHLDLGRLDDAHTLLSDGLRLNPDQPGVAHTLARLQVERGDLPGAIQTLEAARAQRDDPATRAFLGAVLLRAQRAQEAVAHYLVALRADPNNTHWLVGAGAALEAAGRMADAAEAYRRAAAMPGLTADLSGFLADRLARLPATTRSAAR